jgi:hypothetical protein
MFLHEVSSSSTGMRGSIQLLLGTAGALQGYYMQPSGGCSSLLSRHWLLPAGAYQSAAATAALTCVAASTCCLALQGARILGRELSGSGSSLCLLSLVV